MQQTPRTPRKQDNILLESGTNELEVLVFGLGEQSYGVNVAKVREVIPSVRATASPGQPACVKGIFNLRGVVLPLINLHHYLDIPPLDQDPRHHRIIVTEFNGRQSAFKVESVNQIYRMGWDNMRPVPESHGSHHFAITGITEIEGKLVLMLDFESIFDDISMQDSLHIESVENPLGVDRAAHRVLLADDSRFIRDRLESVLTKSGYVQFESHQDGRSAWDSIQAKLRQGDAVPDVVITDIEMPQIDGLALCRMIKTHNQLKHIPVILFSSLITEDTRHKGDQVGADEQIAKPELAKAVGLLDRLLTPARSAAA